MSTKPRRIYLDHNATAPLALAARLAMAAAMDELGNASSVHGDGQRVRARVEAARRAVAILVGRPREDVVFTSGGTEANVLGVLGLAQLAERRGRPRVIATTAIEHPSLAGAVATLAARGWQVVPLAAAADASVVALAAVNHELGTIATLPARGAALVHIDAVQAAGKLPLAPIAAVADSLAISAHKLGGPQGVGALVIADGDALPIGPGAGHQEKGRRAGTENAIGIAGFGAAAAAVDVAAWPAVAALGDRLEAGLRAIGGVRIHGDDRPRVGGTVNAGFAGAVGEAIVVALDLAGVSVSTGAACTSGTVASSPVLLGIGLSELEARSAVRFSLGVGTTVEDIDEVLRILPAIVERARRFGTSR